MDTLEALHYAGYCILDSVLTSVEVSHYLSTIQAMWLQEQELNPKFCRRSPQYMVSNIPVKTRVFDDLLMHPLILEVGNKLLGDNFIMSELRACNVERCDEVAFVHRDSYIPTAAQYPLALLALWTLEEYSHENGATVLYPGSHHWEFAPKKEILDSFACITADAPPGSLVLVNLNVWHGPSANVSGRSRWTLNTCYVPWYVKPYFDITSRFTKEEFRMLPDELKKLFGFNTIPPTDETQRIHTVRSLEELE